MEYLTIKPTYGSSGLYALREDRVYPVGLAEFDLPAAFITRFEKWVKAYEELVILPSYQLPRHKSKIKSLDIEGVQLAEELRRLVKGGAKVKYYSEGEQRYLLWGNK